MLNKLIKTITVLALTIGGSAIAMQQNQRPAAAQRPQMVCSGGQCRLVQQPAAAPVARGSFATPAAAMMQGKATIGLTPSQTAAQKARYNELMNAQAAAPVARGGVATPAAAMMQGKATVGLTPSQTAAQKARYNELMNAQGTRSSVNQNAPAAQSGYVSQQGYVGIPVPR